MIDFAAMNVGDKYTLDSDEWNDEMRIVLDQATEFANSKEPRWQFQFARASIGNRSIRPPTKDVYEVERIR